MTQTIDFKRSLQHLPIILILMFTLVAFNGGAQQVNAGHTDWPSHGIICTENETSTFTLTTRTGHISLPDGNVAYMWGFSEGDQPFQHPSPVLCVKQNQLVTIVVHNTLKEDISLIFPGQEDVMANGTPAQPQFDANGQMTSLTNVVPPNGSMTYSFVAKKAGTFLYESGTNPGIQVNMGLFGALIVRPDQNVDGNTYAYNDLTTRYTPDEEFLMLLSEIDPYLHTAVEQGQPFDMNTYRARYWMINGRGFPDTIAPNGASWLPYQPYSSMGHIYPYDEASHPYPALIRYLSTGSENYPFHPHGNHGRIIARDGNLLRGTANEDLSYEEFTVLVGPGQTLDAMFDWRNIDGWHPSEPGKQIPVTIPQLQNLTFGQFYSGSPYLGNMDSLPVGTQALNQCGEYYHIAHNHALHQITAWGVVLSGHITFNRIDPPLPNECD